MIPWKRTVAVVTLCHLTVDLFVGMWAVYKTLAELDLLIAGLIVAACGFIGDGSQLFFGYLGDRGRRKALVVLGLLLASTSAFLPLTTSYPLLFLLVLMTFIGSGAFHPNGAGAVQSLLSSRKSFTIALFALGGATGLASTQLLFSYFYLGNPHLIGLFALLPLLAILLVSLVPFVENTPDAKRFSIRRLFAPLTDVETKRTMRALYFSQIFQQASVYALLTYSSDVLRCQKHSSWICFGGGHCLMIIGTALFVVPIGLLADRIGQKKVLLGLGFFTMLFFFLFILQGRGMSEPLLGALLMLLGAANGSFSPMGIALGNRLIPKYASSVSALLMGGVWSIAYLLGPGVCGLLTSFFTEDVALWSLAIMGLYLPIAIYFTLRIPAEEEIVVASDYQ